MIYYNNHKIVDYTGWNCMAINNGVCGFDGGRIQYNQFPLHDVLIFLRQFSNGQWSWLLPGRHV